MHALSVFIALFSRMIQAKKSAPFWNHAGVPILIDGRARAGGRPRKWRRHAYAVQGCRTCSSMQARTLASLALRQTPIPKAFLEQGQLEEGARLAHDRKTLPSLLRRPCDKTKGERPSALEFAAIKVERNAMD
jgi:hypothetical protein